MERRGEKGKNRQGQKQLDESVLITARRPEEDQSPTTGETDVKKNPPGDPFVSQVGSSGAFHIITVCFSQLLICGWIFGTLQVKSSH